MKKYVFRVILGLVFIFCTNTLWAQRFYKPLGSNENVIGTITTKFEEQRFGTTSDVDDNTAARMGHLAGASVVITGRVDGEGNLRRLRLRALNTETAQVIGTASERL